MWTEHGESAVAAWSISFLSCVSSGPSLLLPPWTSSRKVFPESCVALRSQHEDQMAAERVPAAAGDAPESASWTGFPYIAEFQKPSPSGWAWEGWVPEWEHMRKASRGGRGGDQWSEVKEHHRVSDPEVGRTEILTRAQAMSQKVKMGAWETGWARCGKSRHRARGSRASGCPQYWGQMPSRFQAQTRAWQLGSVVSGTESSDWAVDGRRGAEGKRGNPCKPAPRAASAVSHHLIAFSEHFSHPTVHRDHLGTLSDPAGLGGGLTSRSQEIPIFPRSTLRITRSPRSFLSFVFV